jgi:vacuolar-type H+-ATPase subunit I/STV1
VICDRSVFFSGFLHQKKLLKIPELQSALEKRDSYVQKLESRLRSLEKRQEETNRQVKECEREKRDLESIFFGNLFIFVMQSSKWKCWKFESGSGWGVQHYVIKVVVSDLWQVGVFLRFPPPKKITATIKLKYDQFRAQLVMVQKEYIEMKSKIPELQSALEKRDSYVQKLESRLRSLEKRQEETKIYFGRPRKSNIVIITVHDP